MYAIDANEEFLLKLNRYFDEFSIPFLNNVQLNISYIKNNDINNLIDEIHVKYNEIISKSIIEIATKEKFLLMLFDYYFLFVPGILKKNIGENFYNDVVIQYIFLIAIINLVK